MKNLVTILALLLLTTGLSAQEPIKNLSKFIDADTLAVVYIDLEKIELDPLMRALDLFGEIGENPKMVELLSARQALLAKGVKNISLTYGASDFPNFPVLILQGTKIDTAFTEQTMNRHFPGHDLKHRQIQGLECIGTTEALDLATNRKPKERPELQAALAESQGGVVQIALALTDDARRIHEQMLPMLPPEIGGGDIRKLTRDLKWISLHLGSGKQIPVRWVIQTENNESATELLKMYRKANELLQKTLVEQDPTIAKAIPDYLRSFQTEVKGNQIIVRAELADAKKAMDKSSPAPPAARIKSQNNLKQLTLAMHNYLDTYGYFPNNVLDKDGKPLLSWRVQLLPFVEQDNLYKQFKLDEPWDSKHNKQLIEKMPPVLRSPFSKLDPKLGKTVYLGPKGPGTLWDIPLEKDKQGKYIGLGIAAFTDGTSNTIAVLECDDTVATFWTKPDDLPVDPKNPLKGVIRPGIDGFNTAFCDGSVRFIRSTVDPTQLWFVMTRAGGEVADIDRPPMPKGIKK